MQDELIEIFYQRLEEYRIKARKKKEELADDFHMHRSTLNENMKGKLPTTEMIIRLAELSGLSVPELLKVDREETVEEKRKRVFLQQIWEVVEKFTFSTTDSEEKKDTDEKRN